MKKTYLYLVALVIIFCSCSSGGTDDSGPDTEPENTAPTIPVQVYPLNNTLCINNNVVFEWNASSDAEGNAITYRVEVSEASDFSNLAHDVSSSSNSRVISLDKGKSFYWRVKSKDTKGDESGYSSVSQFLTEGDGVSNHLPFAPELVTPNIDEVINGTSATLSWTANDLDNDALTYDVYLDTVSNPTAKVSENQTETMFNATNLTSSTTYYFKVAVKDTNGGVTIGQVWRFKTQ